MVEQVSDSEKQPQYINSVTRALHILELYGKLGVESLGIAEIGKELHLGKSTVFNLVKTLSHQGWLIQDAPNGKYKLSPRVLMVASAFTRSMTNEDLILPEMHRLRDRFNEDVVLTAMVDGAPICVEKVQSSNMLRIQSRVGRLANFLRGSTGKMLFACQPPAFIEKTLDAAFLNDPEGRKRLAVELAQARTQRYCISISEQDEGVASIAVALLNREGFAAYSLAVIGEEHRMRQKGMDEILESLRESALRLERGLEL